NVTRITRRARRLPRRVDCSPYGREPLPTRRDLSHGPDRPDRLRDYHADPAAVRATLRSAGARLWGPRVRLLGDAVRRDGAARAVVGPDRPATDPPHDDVVQCRRLRVVRVRPLVRAAVHRTRDLGLRERLRPLMLVWFLAPFSFAGYTVALPLHATQALSWGAKELGWLFVVIGVIAAAVQGFLFGRLERHTGARALLIVGLFGMAASIA